MEDRKYLVIGLIIILVLSMGCIGNTSPKSEETTPTNQINTASAGQSIASAPVQDAIKQAVISGNLSLSDIDGPPEYTTEVVKKNDSYVELKSTTKLKFKNPKGAGNVDNKWPKIQATTGNIAVDYDQQIKNSITAEIATIKDDSERTKMNDSWNNYSFDSGSRTYEINETYGATYSNNSFINALPTGPISTSNYNILMGFTVPIRWSYHKEETIGIAMFASVWGEVYASVDGALGLRLPTKVRLDGPNIANHQSYTLNTDMSGQDWNAGEYSIANVPPENGNEFVLRGRFILSAHAKIRGFLGITIVDFGLIDLNEGFDYSRSFKTPFGPNEKFPIPEMILSPDQTRLKISNGILWVGAGLKFEPMLGSTKITAKWYANGDAIGEGPIEYQSPNTIYSFSMNVGDYDKSTNYANVKLSNYNYYLNRCILSFDTNIQGGLTSVPKFVLKSPYINIYSYNCGGFTQDIHLGIHPGTNADSVTRHIEVIPEASVLSGNIAIDNSTVENTSGLGTVTVIPTKIIVVNTPTVTPTKIIVVNTPTVTPTKTIVVNTPTVTPTANIPTVTPTKTIVVNTPTVTPTKTIVVNTPTVTPTVNTPTVTPTANIPTVTPTVNIPTVTPTVTYGIGNDARATI